MLTSLLFHLEKVNFNPFLQVIYVKIFCSLFQASKMGHPGSGLPFFCHNGDTHTLSQPPPAHMGIPPYQLDPKGGEYWRAAPQWKRLAPLLAASGEPLRKEPPRTHMTVSFYLSLSSSFSLYFPLISISIFQN